MYPSANDSTQSTSPRTKSTDPNATQQIGVSEIEQEIAMVTFQGAKVLEIVEAAKRSHMKSARQTSSTRAVALVANVSANSNKDSKVNSNEANSVTYPNGDPDPDSDADTGLEMVNIPSPHRLPNQTWNFSALDSAIAECNREDDGPNISTPLTKTDFISLAIRTLTDGSVRHQGENRHRKRDISTRAAGQAAFYTKASRVTRSQSGANRYQVSLPRNVYEKRKERDVAYKRVMGVAKILKR
ncbi:hypothetical protein ONS95_012679 [Cadophora gregata]|uniref:uncharacterized protein n=1 Tax=Cadophora gregata TaxID=51156 RepID=UPI0026DB80C5|nr:uncharacterized protein ONS95_012679 [Cadophora gregata]KAK0118390.1 hypothetical protein ONS95_012679 [Cadophora gregata]KAK0123459.1 hypothetical protein ONS96_010443 [Cadophora gregata f. sp. sojae]